MGMETKKETKKQKKPYVKPAIQKHKAAAIVSGSGSDDDNCVTHPRMFLTTYYH